MAYEFAGPYSYGPELIHRPLMAQTPAGPRSIDWPVRRWARAQPQLGFTWVDPWPWGNGETNGPEIPTYPVDVYAPHCQSIWPWVLGTAVIMLILSQK